jgi:hypothetical protein
MPGGPAASIEVPDQQQPASALVYSAGGPYETTKEMTCRDFADFLDEFLERSLPPELTRQFGEHLKICADCRNYLHGYQQAGQAARAALGAADDAVPARVPEGLVKAILSALAGRQRG